MNRQDIINAIDHQKPYLEEATHRRERFDHHPVKSLWFYLLVALNRYSPFKMPIKARTIWQDRMEAYETSAIGSVYFLGFYDIDLTLFLLKHFNDAGDIIDVGSNIGYYALLGKQIKGPGHKVVAFEPTPSTYKLLRRNVSGKKDLITEPIALSDQSGKITLFDYGLKNAVFNSTRAQNLPFLQGKGNKVEVETTTLDKYCEERGLKPALIKLDTEGTESSILSGGQETLRSYDPVILLELGGGDDWKDNAQKCFDLLVSMNYRFFDCDSYGRLQLHERRESYSYQNLVCLPASKLSSYAAAM